MAILKAAEVWPEMADGIDTKYRSKSFIRESGIFTPDNGEEQKKTMTTYVQKTQDVSAFIKFFPGVLDLIFQTNKKEQRILEMIWKTMVQTPIQIEYVYLNYKIAREDFGYTKDRSEYHAAIRGLEKKGFIRRVEKQPGFLYPNPHYFFRGNRYDAIAKTDKETLN